MERHEEHANSAHARQQEQQDDEEDLRRRDGDNDENRHKLHGLRGKAMGAREAELRQRGSRRRHGRTSCMQPDIVDRRLLSMSLRSLMNRFMTRPLGLRSKKDSGAAMTASAMRA